jgi:hypothetical protein
MIREESSLFYRPPPHAPNVTPAHEGHDLPPKKRDATKNGTYCNAERTVTQFADSFHASFIRPRDNSSDPASSLAKISSITNSEKSGAERELTAKFRRPWDVRLITAHRRKFMDLPLFIAILALLAWTLLPQLDRYADAEKGTENKRSYLSRLARWVNN